MLPERRQRGDALEAAAPAADRTRSAGAVLDFAPRRVDAVRGLEHVDHLRHQRDAANRAGWRRRAGRCGRPLPSQCSSRFWMPCATRFGEAHLARDLGAAMAARLHQLAGDLAAVLEHLDQRAEALRQAGLHAGVRQHEAQRLRQAAVDGLEVLFEGEIVGQDRAGRCAPRCCCSRGPSAAACSRDSRSRLRRGRCRGRYGFRSSSSARNARPAGLRSCRAHG